MRPVVLKIGGAALEREESLAAIAAEVALLVREGARVVIVHGGGHASTRLGARLGLDSTFIDGVRVTDDAHLEVAVMTLAGTMNTSIVGALRATGVDAVGVNGALRAHRSDDSRLGHVGVITSVESRTLGLLLDAGCVPVLSPVALSPEGAPLNVNADTAAGAVAASLDATSLLMVSDVPGVVVDGSIAASLDTEAVGALIASGAISGGMIPKVKGALDALGSGVECVRILDLPALRSAVLKNVGGTAFLPVLQSVE